MKKVRYAIGAIGVLGVAPALGLIGPAANATAAVTHTAGNTGKTVTPEQHVRPLVNCNFGHYKAKKSANGHLVGSIYYSGTDCIHSQEAVLNLSKTGLTERTRFYSNGGTLERTTWQKGGEGGGATIFGSTPNMYAHMVCEALVSNNNHNDVKYGPVCETT